MCCETRLATLEKRVSRIRTCLLIALSLLILLIGIAIGKGGDRRETRGRAATMMTRRGDMRPPMGAGIDGPRDGGPDRRPKEGPGRPDRDRDGLSPWA
jgi:hypothetical protein